jgi:L-threonylcarbamoyladenylate synthase
MSTPAAVAAAILRGETCAIPTETYYALAAAAFDPAALARLLAHKGRTGEHTLALLIEPEQLPLVCRDVPPRARALMAAHWPGPLTLALPARSHLPAAIVQDGCVAVRVPGHALAREVVRAVGGPVTATSANPTGAAPASTPAEVRRYFPDLLVLEVLRTPGGLPSTLARITGDRVEILRAGAVTIED